MPFDKNNPKTRRRRKVCQFCVDKATYIDYKDTAKLRRFLSERSKILPRRTTGTCAMHQPRPWTPCTSDMILGRRGSG